MRAMPKVVSSPKSKIESKIQVCVLCSHCKYKTKPQWLSPQQFEEDGRLGMLGTLHQHYNSKAGEGDHPCDVPDWDELEEDETILGHPVQWKRWDSNGKSIPPGIPAPPPHAPPSHMTNRSRSPLRRRSSASASASNAADPDFRVDGAQMSRGEFQRAVLDRLDSIIEILGE